MSQGHLLTSNCGLTTKPEKTESLDSLKKGSGSNFGELDFGAAFGMSCVALVLILLYMIAASYLKMLQLALQQAAIALNMQVTEVKNQCAAINTEYEDQATQLVVQGATSLVGAGVSICGAIAMTKAGSGENANMAEARNTREQIESFQSRYSAPIEANPFVNATVAPAAGAAVPAAGAAVPAAGAPDAGAGGAGAAAPAAPPAPPAPAAPAAGGAAAGAAAPVGGEELYQEIHAGTPIRDLVAGRADLTTGVRMPHSTGAIQYARARMEADATQNIPQNANTPAEIREQDVAIAARDRAIQYRDDFQGRLEREKLIASNCEVSAAQRLMQSQTTANMIITQILDKFIQAAGSGFQAGYKYFPAFDQTSYRLADPQSGQQFDWSGKSTSSTHKVSAPQGKQDDTTQQMYANLANATGSRLTQEAGALVQSASDVYMILKALQESSGVRG